MNGIITKDNVAESVDKIRMGAVDNTSRMSNDSCYESDLEDTSFVNRSGDDGDNVNGLGVISDTSPVVSDHELIGAQAQVDSELSEAECAVRNHAKHRQYAVRKQATDREYTARNHVTGRGYAVRNHVSDRECAVRNQADLEYNLRNHVPDRRYNVFEAPSRAESPKYGWYQANEGEPDVYENVTYYQAPRNISHYRNSVAGAQDVIEREEHVERRRKATRHSDHRHAALIRSHSAHGERRRVAFRLQDSQDGDECGKGEDSGLGHSLESKLHLQHPYYSADSRYNASILDDQIAFRSSPKPQCDPYYGRSQPKKVNFHDAEFDYVHAGSYPLPVLGPKQVSREGSPSTAKPAPGILKRSIRHSDRGNSPSVAGIKAADIPREGSPGINSIIKRRTKYFDRYDEDKRKARLYRGASQESTVNSYREGDICEMHTADTECQCQPPQTSTPPLACQCDSPHHICSKQIRQCDTYCDINCAESSCYQDGFQYSHPDKVAQNGAIFTNSSINNDQETCPDPSSISGDTHAPLQRSSPYLDSSLLRHSRNCMVGDNKGPDCSADATDAALDVQSNREQLLSRSRSCLGCMMLRQYNFGKGTVFGIFAKPANGYISPTNFHDAVPGLDDTSPRQSPYCDDVMTRSDSAILQSDELSGTYLISNRESPCQLPGRYSNGNIMPQDMDLVVDKKIIAPAKPHIKIGKKVRLRKKPNGNAHESHGLVTIRMKPDAQGRFGFNVKGGSDQGMPIIVSRVAPGTPADVCIPRLNEGDQVLFINGRDVSSHKHEQVVMFIRSAVEQHSRELVLIVRPNVYIGDDTADNEPDFQYTPDTYHISSTLPPGGDLLSGSLTLLQEGIESGAALAQFEQLYRKKQGLTMNACRLESNVNKNRYRDISPYDLTRVKIRTGTGDYINANYVNMEIPGSGIVNRYIAAQGPLPNTSLDFWQMIWEQHCTLVVMLTTNVERGRVKCHKYWPDLYETATMANMQVTCVKEEVTSSFAFREFTLVHSKDGKERHITQIQYISWPDHGVPDDASDFLHFVMRVRQRRSGMTEPTIVHCSAGIGRTGVLITMETAMCLIEANQPVYPLDIVRQMRDQRAMLIQTSSQYKFVCEAILKVYNDKVVQPLEEFKT